MCLWLVLTVSPLVLTRHLRAVRRPIAVAYSGRSFFSFPWLLLTRITRQLVILAHLRLHIVIGRSLSSSSVGVLNVPFVPFPISRRDCFPLQLPCHTIGMTLSNCFPFLLLLSCRLSHLTTVSGRTMKMTPTTPARSTFLRIWVSPCWTVPFRATMPASLPTVKRVAGSRTP